MRLTCLINITYLLTYLLKVEHALQDSVGGCSSPSSRPWARRSRTTTVCDVWPVRRQTYGYLPSREESPAVAWYQIILRGDSGTCWLDRVKNR